METCPGTPFCNSLNEETRRILCQAALQVEVPRSRIVLTDYRGALQIIQRGFTTYFRLGGYSGPTPHILVGTGDVLGINSLAEDMDWNVQMEHLASTVKCIIPHDAIRTLFEEDARFVRALLRQSCRFSVRTARYLYAMHTQDAKGRLAYLAEFLEQFSIGMNELTQEQMALLTGLTRSTVTRTLGVLAESPESTPQ